MVGQRCLNNTVSTTVLPVQWLSVVSVVSVVSVISLISLVSVVSVICLVSVIMRASDLCYH